MVPLRGLAAATWAALALSCSSITGLSDLEKVDCVGSCGSDGGGAGGTAGSGGVTAVTVATGLKSSCAIVSDETLWCWGANPGVEPGTVSTKPVQVSGISGVSQVSIGLAHTCALDSTGTVYCWGRNDVGQLGDGSTTTSNVPKPVSGLPAISTVGAGATHTCAYTGPDSPPVQMFCWGGNSHGQLGDETTQDRLSPVKIEFADGAQVLRLGGGDSYTCAVVESAGKLEARCWGKNDKGQCGVDPIANPVVMTPTVVPGLPSVERIYPGTEHVCTRTTGTRIPYCWGANQNGQIGINTKSPYEPATLVVGGYTIDTMSAAHRHTCLLTQDALAAVCFGANDLGQFSGSPGADQPQPTAEPALDGVAFIMRQSEHGCGVLDGVARCWGANDSGQLGNGSTGTSGPAAEVTFGQ